MGGYDLGNVYGKITLDASGIASGINSARQALNSGFSGMGQSLQSFGDQITGVGARLTALTAPFALFAKSGLNVAADFEVVMKQIESFGGVAGEELEAVRQYALQMGADTKFSAQDSATALLDLLKSGQSLEQAMKTLPDVLNLAAVGEMSLAQAAGIASGNMAIFQMETESLNDALIQVPENFIELQNQLGITDDMFTEWGNNGDGFNIQLETMASQLGTTTEGLYAMWNATKPLTPEMEALANQLGISQADWESYQTYLDGTATSLEAVSPAIQALIDQTGLSGSRLSQLFNPQVSASTRIVDALAQAANASRADVAGLGDALFNGGAIASNYGLDIKETAAVLGVFANNGIMGAEAGTQLKSMLTNMTRPVAEVQDAWKELGTSLYDSEGNLRDFNTVMLELDAAMDALPIEDQNELTQILAGSYGQLGFTALRASNGIGDMLAEMATAPEAGDLAQGFMETFAGKVESLRGSFETLKIEALTPFMNQIAGPFVDRMVGVVNQMSAWAAANPELTISIMQIGSALVVAGPALMATGFAVNNIGFAIKAVAPIFGLLSSPILLIAGAGLALAHIFDIDLRQAFTDTVGAVLPVLDSLRVWVVEEGFPAIVNFVQTTVLPIFRRIGEVIGDLWSRVAPVLSQLYTWFVTTALPAVGRVITGVFIPLVMRIGEAIVEVWEAVAPVLAQLFTWFVEEAIPAIVDIIETVFIPILLDIGRRIGDVWAVVSPVLSQLYTWFVTTALPAIAGFIETVFIPAVQGIAHVFKEIYETVAPILSFLINWFVTQAVPIIAGILTDIIIPAIETFVRVLGAIWGAVAPALQTLIDWFQSTGWPLIEGIINNVITPAINFLVGILKGIWEFVEPVINELVNWFNNVIAPAIDIGAQFVTTAIDAFILIFTGIWTGVESALNSVVNWFNTTIAPAIDEARTKFIQPAVDAVVKVFTDIWNWAKPGLEQLVAGIRPFFDEIGKIIGAVVNEIKKIPEYIDRAKQAIDIFNGQAEIVQKARTVVENSGASWDEVNNQARGAISAEIGGGVVADFIGALLAPIVTNNAMQPPTKDIGGEGLAMMPYLIGKPQENNEIFVPRATGEFIPNFMDKLNNFMAVMDGQQQQQPMVGQVFIQANDAEGGRRAGDAFVARIDQLRRANG